MKALTRRQSEVLAYLRDYQRENGRPPTLREICARWGHRSTNAASEMLDSIARKGYLTRDKMASRGIRLVAEKVEDTGSELDGLRKRVESLGMALVVRCTQCRFAEGRTEDGAAQCSLETRYDRRGAHVSVWMPQGWGCPAGEPRAEASNGQED